MDACIITSNMESVILRQLTIGGGSSVCYDLSIKDDISHIMQHSGNTTTNYFFCSKYGEKSPSSLSTSNSFAFKVSEEIMVPFVTSMMKSLLDMFPGEMRFITIESAALSSEISKEFILSFVETIKQCRHLYIDGRGKEFSDNCSQLLNKVTVTDKISTREFPVDNLLNFKKISEIDTVHLDLLAPTAQNILDAAGKFSIFTVDRFGIRDINKLLTLWAASDIGHIMSLSIKIERPEASHIEQLFEGFTLIGGKDRTCCKFLSTCTKVRCEYSKSYDIANIGMKIIRSDGAESIIAYSPGFCDVSFVMIGVVRKPKTWEEAIRKTIRTTIHDHCKRHIEEMEAWQFIYEKNKSALSAIQKDYVLDWIAEENEREWDDYHKKQIRLYQEYTNKPLAMKTKDRTDNGYLKLTDSVETH
ncbi:hypothetical protein CAEBREN_00919 [Caenorhabditis brenneri]|uniref:Uncharacterized protein n=1 Tax=Caenorhabditis brenneri TaxID=135651 RepID=G0MH09_CAEBE|nr:hypothetical protein CAEBREN_00919 [Caenorhabditis brenneri]